MNLITLKSFVPEVFLSCCILTQLLINARLVNNLSNNFPILTKEVFSQAFFILFCVFTLLSNLKIAGSFFNLLFLNDGGTIMVKAALMIACLFVLGTIARGITAQKLNFFEFYTVFLLSILALLLLVSSYDFISAYLVIEMQALSFYILASFRRDSAFSTEAGLKYFISGSFISCIFLFGCSLVYGALGTLNFNSLTLLLSFPLGENAMYLKVMIMVGSLSIYVTLLFKVAAAPFHFWSPDVYEGSPLSSTVVFAVIPKIALFNFFIKCVCAFSQIFYEFQYLFLTIGVLSIVFGAIFALKQKRIKRLVVYSSVAQVGFIISALATGTVDGFVAVYFFLFIYTLTSTLVWGYITQFCVSQQKANTFYQNSVLSPIFISSFAKYFKLNKVACFSLAIVFFSIGGIPPLSGFLAKVLVLSSLSQAEFFFTFFVIILLSSVSAFYYMRVVKIIFFETKDIKINNQNMQTIFSGYLSDLHCCTMAVGTYIFFFFFFSPGMLVLISHYIVLNTFGF
jgi:NADH-quinone oxidoreductase subunit N